MAFKDQFITAALKSEQLVLLSIRKMPVLIAHPLFSRRLMVPASSSNKKSGSLDDEEST